MLTRFYLEPAPDHDKVLLCPWGSGGRVQVTTRHVHRRLAIIPIALVVFGSECRVDGQVASWVSAVNGSWTDATKWSTSPKYPNSIDLTAIIRAHGAPYTVNLARRA